MVKESAEAKRNKNTPQAYDYDVYHPSNDNNQNDGSHFWHQDTPEQLMPIPPPVPIQSSGVSSLVHGAIVFAGGAVALFMIFKLLARCIGVRSNDIRLISNDSPKGRALKQAQRATKAPEPKKDYKRKAEPANERQQVVRIEYET